MSSSNRFSLVRVIAVCLAALRQRWASLLVLVLAVFGVLVGVDALDGPELPEGAQASWAAIGWEIFLDLFDGLVAGVAMALALGGARGEPLRPGWILRRVLAVSPILLLAATVMEGGGWATAAWAGLASGLPKLPYDAIWYLLVATLVGMTLPVAVDRRLSPPDAVVLGWRLMAGRRWLMLGLMLLLGVVILVAALVSYLPLLALDLEDSWGRQAVEPVIETLMNLALVGVYLEFDRLRGQGPERVADTFA